MTDAVVLDGSMGEGGGQILRTALALSLVTGRPFRIDRIRAGREKPGLRPQHVAAVEAAQRIGWAHVRGAAPGSHEIEFAPGPVRPGTYLFDVGTAGSTTLVLQTILLPLCLTPGPSDVTVVGGTHNPMAPPFEFLERAFLPVLARMGASVRLVLERPGFFPRGGGRIRASVTPAARLAPVDLTERGAVVARRGRVLLAKLEPHIAEREARVLSARGRIPPSDVAVTLTDDSDGPGNAVAIEVRCEHATEVFTAIGVRGVPAERVAAAVVDEAEAWLDADVPVGAHLADQLLVPMALAGRGSFRTVEPTPHTETNARVIEAFLPVRIRVGPEPGAAFRVDVGPAPESGRSG